MNSIRRLILLNQMAGPLFRQLAEDLAPRYPDGCLLLTGHPDTLKMSDELGSGLVVRPAPGYDRRSRLRRVISWFRYVLRATRYVLLARKGDAILLVSNPPLLGPWIWLLSYFRAVHYAVLVYDIHPEVLVRLGVLAQNGLLARIWRALNRRVYRRAAAVVTIGHRMAAVLQRQVGEGGRPVAVVPPWVDVGLIKPLARPDNPYAARFTEPDSFVILYSGNMGASHDIDSMLEAARLLRDDKLIRFIFIGDGEKRADVDAYVSHHRLSNVRAFPFQPEEMLPFTLSLGDISLVALDEGMEDLMVPSKAFFYLAAGSALIAIANDNSELSDLLERSDVGIRVSPRQPEALAGAIRLMAADHMRLAKLRANARMLAERHYSREAGVGAFARILDEAGLASRAE